MQLVTWSRAVLSVSLAESSILNCIVKKDVEKVRNEFIPLRNNWLFLVDALRNLLVPLNAGNFTICGSIGLSRKPLHHVPSLGLGFIDQFCTYRAGCGTVGDVQAWRLIRQATLQYSNTMYLIQMSLYTAVPLFSSRSTL